MAKKAQAQAGDLSRLEMSFDKPHLINAVFGEFDRNLVTIENRLGVYISARGNRVQIEGEAGAIGRTRDVLNDIYSRLSRGQEIDSEAVQSIIAMTAEPTFVRARKRSCHVLPHKFHIWRHWPATRLFSRLGQQAQAKPIWRWHRLWPC